MPRFKIVQTDIRIPESRVDDFVHYLVDDAKVCEMGEHIPTRYHKNSPNIKEFNLRRPDLDCHTGWEDADIFMNITSYNQMKEIANKVLSFAEVGSSITIFDFNTLTGETFTKD